MAPVYPPSATCMYVPFARPLFDLDVLQLNQLCSMALQTCVMIAICNV